MNLTAQQIKWSDDINFDKNATESTLNIALQYHANRKNELAKETKKLWENIAETFDLDLDENTYKISRFHNNVTVVKIEDEDIK